MADRTTRGTPFYTPDYSRPNFRKEWLRSQAARVTWQATSIHKFNVFADVQNYEVRGRGQFTAPEATMHVWSFWPNGLYQLVWNAPITNKLLLEAGTSFAQNGYPYTRKDVTDIFGFEVPATDVPILEASTGFRYNAKDRTADDVRATTDARRSAADADLPLRAVASAPRQPG